MIFLVYYMCGLFHITLSSPPPPNTLSLQPSLFPSLLPTSPFPPLSFLSMIIANGSRLHLPNNADSQFWATFISGYLQKTLDHWRSHTHTHAFSALTHTLSLSLFAHTQARVFSISPPRTHSLTHTLSLTRTRNKKPPNSGACFDSTRE